MKREIYLNPEDKSAVKRLRKQLLSGSKFFVARKTGSNARGDGANRSVILGKHENSKTWHQAHKVWGAYNEERARKIIQEITHTLTSTTTD